MGAPTIWWRMTIPILTVELIGKDSLVEKLKLIEELSKYNRMQEAWKTMVEIVAGTARAKAPYWRGDLAVSIEEEVRMDGENMIGEVFTDLFYAPFQERGTDPYFPNVDNLIPWAGSTKAAWGVALAIATRGLIPRKFFEKALLQEETTITGLVGDVVAEIMEGKY